MNSDNLANLCCDMMSRNASLNCEIHNNKYDCPDVLINFNKKTESYGIIIHDGGTSMISINYCPWCGTNLNPND